MKTLAQIREAATSALVAFYNANVSQEKQIKKFSDRATAIARCVKIGVDLELPDTEEELLAEQEAANSPNPMFAQLAGGMTAKQKAATSALSGSGQKVVSGKTVVDGEDSEEEPLIPFRASNAAGVSASWGNAEVREARLTRDGVAVSAQGASETEHKSTRDAFRHYRLPDSKHIRFRLKLKANGTETFEWNGKKYVFTLRPISAE